MSRVKRELADIWRVNLDEPRGLLLSNDEKQRAARFHFEQDRVRWSRARSALRIVLARYTECEPSQLVFAIGEHGKPFLAASDLQFNLSHSGEWAYIAVSRNAPVGIDVERIRERVDMAKLLRRIGESPGESGVQELFQLWANREARTKATGMPLMQNPPDSVRAAALSSSSNYVAAVAMDGADPEPRYCAPDW